MTALMTTHTSSSSSTTTTTAGGRWHRVEGGRGRSDTKGHHGCGTFRRCCGSKSGGRGRGQPGGMESHRVCVVCVCVCERETVRVKVDNVKVCKGDDALCTMLV